MARKFVEENERIKRRYLQYLREAKRCDMATVDKTAEGILRFERSTGFKPFKRFHIDQAMKFKAEICAARNNRTAKPLSKATIDGTLRAVKAFVSWLAGQPGYRSRISYGDAEYFNLNAKDVRVAHAQRDAAYPTMEQCRHAFVQMPSTTPLQRRDKAIFAFLMLTGSRDGAVASFRLKRIDLVQGCAYQDARDVRTKFAKSFTTWFLPVDPIYREFFVDWVAFLRNDLLFGNEDALFPKQEIGQVDQAFSVTGFSRETYANADAIRSVIKDAFVAAGLPAFAPHSFRKTLVKWADGYFTSREAFKAFSQNIGHDSELTTVGSYLMVSQERQAELMRGPTSG
ncbi:site-specific integrase [Frigidibacter sp. RF13]|uniref:site-specific integrase n=1 Tax=Frigidibacter sp. RF13 TaxID=2997340 RepID=UPI002271BE38|nr:site-specific integrase [Frigidibacter sp. RF13]MCY1128021.1 site-specific integrase [Frigidibacter sp. RF13]